MTKLSSPKDEYVLLVFTTCEYVFFQFYFMTLIFMSVLRAAPYQMAKEYVLL